MKAILVVSFGSSHKDTREKTIDRIEEDIRNRYTNYTIYNAYTSKIILNKIKREENKKINTVKEAMEQMLLDGVDELIVQPTHILNGIENDIMTEEIMEYEKEYKSIVFGRPLLTSTDDYRQIIDVFVKNIERKDDTAVILMGHGTDHYVNSSYAALDYMIKHSGYEDVYVATVEAFPEIDDVLAMIKKKDYKKVRLIPFMIVAGDHAKNDMAGEEDSWKTLLTQNGYEVECVMSGLGEYKGVRDMFISHIEDAFKERD